MNGILTREIDQAKERTRSAILESAKEHSVNAGALRELLVERLGLRPPEVG